MEIIENVELKKNLLNQTYYNDYIFRLEQKDPKYLEKILSEHLIVKTDDNYYIIIDVSKPSISSDLWYDDETEPPEKTEEYFVKYNLSMNGSRLNFKKEEMYIYDPYYEKPKDNLVKVSDKFCCDAISNGTFKRDLTENEKDFIGQIFSSLLDEYVERLKRYYKRYNRCIHVRGYWVNR